MTKLSELRKQKGLTQSELADQARINLRNLQHYECGDNPIDRTALENLIRLSLVLDCKISDIIDNQEVLNLIKEYNETQATL